jgi:hypothetical protein
MNEPATKRRFFRFRLRTLLLLPILVAAGWWWWTWPERTARRFVERLNAGDIEDAKAAFGPPQRVVGGFITKLIRPEASPMLLATARR